MRLVPAFSSSACRSRQALFEFPDQTSREDKDFLLRRKRGAYTANPFIGKDSKVIRTAFHCEYSDLDQLRSQCVLQIAAALAKLQDPKSFAVKDLTFDKIMGPPTISYPAELVLIDHQNPLGVPPDTPKLAIPPIHDPSLVAKALSEAGFTGSFFRFQHQLHYEPLAHTENLPWPSYKHLPRGGYIYPPRLHITHQKLDTVTLTLPGATVLPLYKFFEWFHRDNRDFKTTNELVTLWARSHDIGLSPQAIALMVVSAMQTEKPFFIDRLELTGWSNVEYSNGGQWHQTVGSVHVDFNKVHSLPPAAHDINLLNFFMHWKGHHLKSGSFAFTVRNGRSNQSIPRQYTTDVPSYKGFFKSNMDDPTQEFPPWRYDRFVIQDPFLVTHNHAEHLPDGAYRKFGHHLLRTFDFLRAGRPLPWIFGTHAAPPGSDAETKILGDLDVYSTALNLLEKDRIPQDLGRWGGRNNLLRDACDDNDGLHPSSSETDPRLKRRKTSTFRGRSFHTASISLRSYLNHARIVPPEPATSPKDQGPAKEQEGWGLNAPLVHNPSFWRPVPLREPLTLPARAGSTNPLPSAQPMKPPNPVPPVRATRAGVAYKNVSSKPKGFHTAAHSTAPQAKGINRTIDESVRASRRQTLFSVQDAIRKACGNEYRVELFGSTRYGISSAKSDLDMVILDPHMPHGFAPGKTSKGLKPALYDVRNIARALRKAGFYILETLPMATVPIVKFKDQKTGHFVDLNVNDRLGVHNSDLIKQYCQLNPVLRTMIQYIKMWAKPLGLNRPSPTQRGASVTFSSYALVMMTIGFLQHRGLLPNLQEGLPPLEPGKLTGTFWLKKPRPLCCDVRYQQAVGWTPPEDVAVPQLMQDWFRFYGLEFQYNSEMISVRQGGCLQRLSNPEWRLPFTGVMWNIDPFIRTKNITGAIGRRSIAAFKSSCLQWANERAFEQGYLPRPTGSFDDSQLDELERLMLPVDMQDAQWLPVEGIMFPASRNGPQKLTSPVMPQDSHDAEPPREHLLSDPAYPEERDREGVLDEGVLPLFITTPSFDTPEPISLEASPPATPSSSIAESILLEASPPATTPSSDILEPITFPVTMSMLKNAARGRDSTLRAEWLPVEDELPLPWRSNRESIRIPTGNDEVEPEEPYDANLLIFPPTPPSIPKKKPTKFAARLPASASSTEDSTLDYDPALHVDKFGRIVESGPPPKIPPQESQESDEPVHEDTPEEGPPTWPENAEPNPSLDASPVFATSTEDQALDYDPALRFDAFGRLIAPEPPRPLQVTPEEPETDEVGFGLKI